MISPCRGLRVLIKKRISSEILSSDLDERESVGREKMRSEKRNNFFDLEVVNSKSNSWRMKIHFEKFPPSNYRDKM